MRDVIVTSKRCLSAALAVLLVLQATIIAWHGAGLAAARLGATDGGEAIVICSVHGFMRVVAEDLGLPPAQAPDPTAKSIKCPLCLALSAGVWALPLDIVLALLPRTDAIAAPHELLHVAHAPRAPPRQRGPPTLV